MQLPIIFASNCSQVLNEIPRRNVVMIVGDFNVQIGKDNETRAHTLRKFGIGQKNSNIQQLLEFAEDNDRVITDSLFCHPKSHKQTWCTPDGFTRTVIDHVRVNSH